MKIPAKYFAKVTVDVAFLRINSFTSIFEEVWQQFELANFMNLLFRTILWIYCSEQFFLYNSNDCSQFYRFL